MSKRAHKAEHHATPIQDAEPTTRFVTYLPDDGDNDTTTVHGIAFKADEPTELDMTNPTHGTVLARIEGNPFFHIGDDPPPSKKSKAVADRAAGVLDRLEDIVGHFRDGTATHYHADELARISREIKESKR